MSFSELLIFSSDPTYVVAPVLRSRPGREDLKKLFAGSFSFSCMLFIYSLLVVSTKLKCVLSFGIKIFQSKNGNKRSFYLLV